MKEKSSVIITKTIEELKNIYGITGEEYENCRTWYKLSLLPLPEEFIEKYADDVDWESISMYQKLSETFIEKHTDEVDWENISIYQKLSEKFIEKYADEVDWQGVSYRQKLSENFIGKHIDDVDWIGICKYQKLSEGFIEKYAGEVVWHYISIYQQLSEDFIRRHKKELFFDDIARHQVISKEFARELDVTSAFLQHNNCLKPASYWKDTVEATGLYECHDDYFYAYKGIRSDRYSRKNFQYRYLPGETCECFSDYSDDENSFGLSAWTKEKAADYCNELVIKVKIYYEDVTAVVHDGGKIRCKKLTVLN